jgi:hypothetical protein
MEMSQPRRWVLASAAAILGLGLGLVPTPPVMAQAADPGLERKVQLDLREIPLRDAVSLLFRGSGLQYSIDPNIPNVPITLNIRDVSLPAALRLIIRQAATTIPGLTQTKDGEVYVIRIRQQSATPPPPVEEAPPEQTLQDSDLTWEKIPIQFNSVAVFSLAFGGTMLPTEMDVMGMMGGGMGGMGGMMGGMGGMGGMMGGMGGMGGMMGGMGGMGGMMGGMGGFGGGMGGFGGGMGGMGGGLGNFGGGGFGGGMGGGFGGRF